MMLTHEVVRCPFCDAKCGTIDGKENMPPIAYVQTVHTMVTAHMRDAHPEVFHV
jgi:hypothetical protein